MEEYIICKNNFSFTVSSFVLQDLNCRILKATKRLFWEISKNPNDLLGKGAE